MQTTPIFSSPVTLVRRTAIWTFLGISAGVLLALGGWTIAQSATPAAESVARTFSFADSGKLLDSGEIEAALERDSNLTEFIDDLEEAVLTADRQFLRAAVDERAMMERIVDRAPDSLDAKSMIDAYRIGTFDAWKNAGVLENYAGGHYRYLRPRTIAGRSGLLFRLAEDGDVINYHLHEIVMTPDGTYKIADIYVVGLREAVSDALWRGLGHLLAETHPEVAPGGTPERSFAFVESIQTVGALSRAVMTERFQEAIDIYGAMPPTVQKVRDVLLMRIEAAAKLSPLELDDALDDWKNLGFAETDLPMKFIDYYTARGHYEKARNSALEVSEIVGGEPYLRARIGELNFAIENQLSSGPQRSGRPARTRRVARGGTAYGMVLQHAP